MGIFSNLIKENLWCRKEYFWEFDGYKVPRIISGKSRNIEDVILDIEKNHYNLLENNKELPNVNEFKKFFNSKYDFKLIEEFPVPINSDIWKDIYRGLGGKKSSTENKGWFSLDFYIPDLGVAIQLDSKIAHGTNDNKIRDNAEDIYLWSTHDIVTIRSSKLQFEDLRKEEFIRLEKEINSFERKTLKFDYSEEFIKFIEDYYKEEFGFIRKYLFNNSFYNEITGERSDSKKDELVISKLPKEDQSFLEETVINSFIMEGIELTRQENISYLYRLLFKKEVIFKP